MLVQPHILLLVKQRSQSPTMFCFRGCGRPGAGGGRAGQPGAEGEAGAGDGHLPQQTVQHLCQRVKMGMMTDSTYNITIIQHNNTIE